WDTEKVIPILLDSELMIQEKKQSEKKEFEQKKVEKVEQSVHDEDSFEKIEKMITLTAKPERVDRGEKIIVHWKASEFNKELNHWIGMFPVNKDEKYVAYQWITLPKNNEMEGDIVFDAPRKYGEY